MKQEQLPRLHLLRVWLPQGVAASSTNAIGMVAAGTASTASTAAIGSAAVGTAAAGMAANRYGQDTFKK
jgi:hypothetical protein